MLTAVDLLSHSKLDIEEALKLVKLLVVILSYPSWSVNRMGLFLTNEKKT